jgi:gamma-glutamylputrescine oxidase
MTVPHTASYYAATANDTTRYPALDGDVTADVCVIGGGYSGLSTAIFLADRGAKVVLLEANRIGWGASGRNGGQVLGGLPGDGRIAAQLGDPGRRLLADLHYRGHDIIEDRIKRFAIACDFKRGTLEAAVKLRHMDGLKAYSEDFARDHPDHQLRLLTKSEVRDALGTDAYCGGMIDGRNAHCHPLNLALGEARGAASLGVALHEESPVTAIQHGSRPVVETARGRVTCNQVVLAGNAYHQLERRRLSGLLFPAGTYIVTTEPLPEAVASRINRLDVGVCDTRMVLDYYRLTADRRLLFGGLCNYSNRVPSDISAALRPRIVELWPELARTRIAYQWGGQIGIVLSRVPLLGRSAANVFFLQGYSGHGVNVTHLASEIVADAMDGRSERLELFERMRQFRAPVGQWLGNQMLALGMAYYRVRDWV